MRVTASAALLALRMWWPLVTVMALIGAALGGFTVRNAPYVAVTTMRVDTAGFGEVAQQSIVQTARLLVDSNRVYSKVAGNSPAAIEELRQRTAVDIVESSSVLEISVSARVPDQAERELNAITEASITSMRELADEQFTGTIRAGRDALTNGVLPDAAAESARRDGIGTSISERQDNALRLSAQLSRIGAVLPAARTGLGTKLAAVIGALGGVFAGSVLALMLGVGRRRIKSLSDVRSVAPGLLHAEPREYTTGIVTVGADCSRIDYALAMVLALPGAEEDLREAAEAVRSDLARNGSRPFRLDADEVVRAERHAGRRGAAARSAAGEHRSSALVTSAVPALGMPQRAVDLSESHTDTLLVIGQANEQILTHAGGRADVVLLIARPYRTTLGQLARATAALRDGRPPLVVLARPGTKVEGASASRPDAGEPAAAPAVRAPGVELSRPGNARPFTAPPRSDRPAGHPGIDGPTLRTRPVSVPARPVGPNGPNGSNGSSGSAARESLAPRRPRAAGPMPPPRPSAAPLVPQQSPRPSSDRGTDADTADTADTDVAGGASVEAPAVELGPIDTGPSDTGPSDTGPSDTGPSDTGPSDTGPSDTGPSDTSPNDTGPAGADTTEAASSDNTPATPADGGSDDAADVEVAPEPRFADPGGDSAPDPTPTNTAP